MPRSRRRRNAAPSSGCFLAFLALVPLTALAGAPAAAKPDTAAKKASPRCDPTSQYEVQTIEGWSVLVNKAFVRGQPELWQRTLKLLRQQLYQIVRLVPAPAVAKLRKVRIWVEEKEGHHPCMAYHPNPGWLRAHDMNPDKGRCVEVANARNFLGWTRDQPWMVLHELSHAYHDQFLGGYGNAEIRAAYKHAMDKKLYDRVLRIGGRTVKAYAATNPMEYFAETTEAFFGTNDFYPFVRVELQQHDPTMFALLEKLWGTKRKRK